MLARLARLFSKYPLHVTSAIAALVNALIFLMIAFDMAKFTEGQIAALIGVVNSVLTIVNASIMSDHVTPLANPKDSRGVSLIPVDQLPAESRTLLSVSTPKQVEPSTHSSEPQHPACAE